MATILDVMRESGDFVELPSKDDYAKYFNHMSHALALVKAWYKHIIKGGNTDALHTEIFIDKLLEDLKKHREKYLHDTAHKLPLDLNDSGFPNSWAFMELESDLALKDNRILTATPENMLIGQMLDVMILEKREPTELLKEMSQGKYFSTLDRDKLLLIFTPGELQLLETTEEVRKYIFSWACYDVTSSLPYFHLLAFEQDLKDEPLEMKGVAYNQFVDVIKAQGGRASTVGGIAMCIDDNLKSIHPKVLKRVRIGPIICPRFSREKKPEPIYELLKEFGSEGDFAIKLMSELVLSERQEKKKVSVLDFGHTKRVKEIFAIPTNDLRCFNQRTSMVFDNLILPHQVLQLSVADPRFAQYAKMGHIAYNEKGDLYVVGK